MPKVKFSYQRRMQFYETDGMGIIHHANYLLLLEEARLQFLRELSGDKDGDILSDINYPLVSAHVDYKLALKFNDLVTIDYEVSTEGAKLIFEYCLWTKSVDKPSAFGKTVHVAFDMRSQRAIRLPEAVINFINQRGQNHGS